MLTLTRGRCTGAWSMLLPLRVTWAATPASSNGLGLWGAGTIPPMWTWKTHGNRSILYPPTRCTGTPRWFTWTYALSNALRKHVVCVWALMGRVFAAFDSVSLSLNLSGFRRNPSFELLHSVSWCKTLWVSFDNGTGEEPPFSSKRIRIIKLNVDH